MTKSRLPRYILVGASAYIAEMSSLYGFIHVANYTPVKAVAYSFWIGFLVAFTLQKLVTFANYEHKAQSLAKQMLGYGLLVVWNYGFTLIAVSLLTPYISAFVARTGAIMIIACWNYFVYHKIFKSKKIQNPYPFS